MSAPARPLTPPAGAGSRVGSWVHGIPLRDRLVGLSVLLTLAALLLTTLATTQVLRGYLMDRTDADLRSDAGGVADWVLDERRPGYEKAQGSLPPAGYAVQFMWVGSDQPERRRTNRSDSFPDIPWLEPQDPRVMSAEPFTVRSTDGRGSWRVVAGKVTESPADGTAGASATVATFAVAVPLDPVEQTLRRLTWLALVTGALATLVCAVVGWYAITRAFRPLRRIEDTARAIAAGGGGVEDRRVPVAATNDEVASLSRSINTMLEQIEQSFAVREASEERMRQFMGDASHELRTPLAAIRGYAELHRIGAIDTPEDTASAMGRIEAEATRMGSLVEDLLQLTRLDSRQSARSEPVDLTVLAVDAVADAHALAPGRAIAYERLPGHEDLHGDGRDPRRGEGAEGEPAHGDPEREEPEAVVVLGDEGRLRQVVTNLVGNAVRHTPDGTPVTVQVGAQATPQGDRLAVLRVVDHGPGVPEPERQHVFERFYRSDPSRQRASGSRPGRGGGSGLGLSIVASAVASMGGQVEVVETPGGGATFVVRLPLHGEAHSSLPATSETSQMQRRGAQGR